jgi:flagellar M-ring protein FliF
MAETGQAESGELQRADPAIPASGAAARAAELAASMRDKVMALPPGRRNSLLALTAFIAAMAAAMVWYGSRRDWKPLFTGLDGKDVQQVSQELAPAGIPYQMTSDGGSIEVPAEMVDKARMEVAAKGMPQTGRLGFELFDKPNWVGSCRCGAGDGGQAGCDAGAAGWPR